jgi:hypothetical protein
VQIKKKDCNGSWFCDEHLPYIRRRVRVERKLRCCELRMTKQSMVLALRKSSRLKHGCEESSSKLVVRYNTLECRKKENDGVFEASGAKPRVIWTASMVFGGRCVALCASMWR